MRSSERELNDYLFLEFGFEEEEESSISDTWPFSLRRLGEIGVREIFEFDDDDKSYFAIGGPCLDFLPKNWLRPLFRMETPGMRRWASGSNHNARVRRQKP